MQAAIRRRHPVLSWDVWREQDPPATDVLLDVTVPFSGGGTPAYLEIDKLPEGRFRATVGTLFEFQELCRTGGLEGLLRHTRAVQLSRSFDEMGRYPGNAGAG
jgi:hypothetical protein